MHCSHTYYFIYVYIYIVGLGDCIFWMRFAFFFPNTSENDNNDHLTINILKYWLFMFYCIYCHFFIDFNYIRITLVSLHFIKGTLHGGSTEPPLAQENGLL